MREIPRKKGIEEWRESGHKSRGKVARKIERQKRWVWKKWVAEYPKAAWSPPQLIPPLQPLTSPHRRRNPTSPLVAVHPLLLLLHSPLLPCVVALSLPHLQFLAQLAIWAFPFSIWILLFTFSTLDNTSPSPYFQNRYKIIWDEFKYITQ